MNKIILVLFIVLTCSLSVTAQQYPRPSVEAKDKFVKQYHPVTPRPSQSKFLGFRNPPSQDLNWQSSLTKISGNESENDELAEKIKKEKNRIKEHAAINTPAAKTTLAAPALGTNFVGLINGGGNTPLDNTVAISNSGVIVAFVNHKIGYYNTSGTLTYSADLYAFINDATLVNNVCDPKVIYDNQADKFIFYAQTCDATSANSFVIIGFSVSNDPTAGWNISEFTGNPLGDASWFDYPKIGISNDELFVTGNLFYEAGGFNESVIYQFNKAQGYAGTSVTWQYWSGITGAFTILPASFGQTGSYGPGIFLVSTAGATSGSTNINLFEITNNIASTTAVLNHYNVSTTSYSTPGDASQLGTTRKLNTGDCRALDGFYLNGTVHFVFHKDAGSGYSGLVYNRVNTTAATNVSTVFSNVGTTDLCYPAIASSSSTATDGSVIIAYNESGSTINPRTCAVACDNSLTWSPPLVVKNGDGYVHYSWATSATDRWGDYTGMCRKFNASAPEAWMAGMYGTASHIWFQWIAKLTNGVQTEVAVATPENMNMKVYPNPVVENYDVVFSLKERQQVSMSLVDMQGKIVADLFTGIAEPGENMFSFNKASLLPGTYTIYIKGTSSILKNEKIIIAGK